MWSREPFLMNLRVTLSCSLSRTTTGASVESTCQMPNTHTSVESHEADFSDIWIATFNSFLPLPLLQQQMGRATSTRGHDSGRKGNDIRLNPIQCCRTKLNSTWLTQLCGVRAFPRHSQGEGKGRFHSLFFILRIRRQLSEEHKSTQLHRTEDHLLFISWKHATEHKNNKTIERLGCFFF